MKINEVIVKKYWSNLNDVNVAGLDIGSRTSKGVLIANGEIYTAILPTGLYMQETANELLDNLLKEGKLGGGAAILRRKRIEEEVRKTNARGIILYGITGCPYATIVKTFVEMLS